MDPKDFLPPPPWQGPPIPDGVWQKGLVWRRQETTLFDLGQLLDHVEALEQSFPRYAELIAPHAEEWERQTFRDFRTELERFKGKMAEVIVAIGEIRKKGLI